jgi:hypothetical protein
VFIVGEWPVVTVSAAAPVSATRVFRDYAAYRAAWEALPTADVVVEGPESSRSIVLLGKTRETRTSRPEGDTYTWTLEPFRSREASLARAMKPGRYRVSVKAAAD